MLSHLTHLRMLSYKENKITVHTGVLKIEMGCPPNHFKQDVDGINHYDLGVAALLHFLSFPPMKTILLESGDSYSIPPLVPFKYLSNNATYEDTVDVHNLFIIG